MWGSTCASVCSSNLADKLYEAYAADTSTELSLAESISFNWAVSYAYHAEVDRG
jgi:hypothetical protein